jgi:hypothetical protein
MKPELLRFEANLEGLLGTDSHTDSKNEAATPGLGKSLPMRVYQVVNYNL